MERRLPLIAVLLYFLCTSLLFSQAPVQQEQLRIQIWAELDAFPGRFEDNSEYSSEEKKDNLKDVYAHAINRSREIAPFLLSGMLTGWAFEYTPYDKTRNVKEYWNIEEIQPFSKKINPIEFHDPHIENERLVSWIYCNRTPFQQNEYKRRKSIVYPRVMGRGKGKLEDGFEGIRTAVSEAAKNAVREYWRIHIKNKPKEITGSLILINEPRIFLLNGEYNAHLEFYLETYEVTGYSVF